MGKWKRGEDKLAKLKKKSQGKIKAIARDTGLSTEEIIERAKVRLSQQNKS